MTEDNFRGDEEIAKLDKGEENKPEGREKEDKKGLFIKVFKKKEKKKQMAILFLRSSGKAEVIYTEPKHGMYEIEGVNYHERYGTDWELKEGFKTKKVKIIPEWGMYPLGNADYLKQLRADEAGVQYDMIRAIQTAETVRLSEERGNKKINPKVAVLVIIALVVAAYFMLGG